MRDIEGKDTNSWISHASFLGRAGRLLIYEAHMETSFVYIVYEEQVSDALSSVSRKQ